MSRKLTRTPQSNLEKKKRKRRKYLGGGNLPGVQDRVKNNRTFFSAHSQTAVIIAGQLEFDFEEGEKKLAIGSTTTTTTATNSLII